MRRILDADGHTVLTAEDGQQGVLLTRREQPEVVLTDLHMPGLDGQALCDVLREDLRTSSTRIIAMSTAAALHQSSPDLMADAVISKPFTANLLVANINLQLQKCKSPRVMTAASGA